MLPTSWPGLSVPMNSVWGSALGYAEFPLGDELRSGLGALGATDPDRIRLIPGQSPSPFGREVAVKSMRP